VATRIAIVGGGGGVGSSLAFNLLLAPESYEIGLVDGHSGMARSHEMDLQQVVAAGRPDRSASCPTTRSPAPTSSSSAPPRR
jgi:malate/lactate dehydrogenase